MWTETEFDQFCRLIFSVCEKTSNQNLQEVHGYVFLDKKNIMQIKEFKNFDTWAFASDDFEEQHDSFVHFECYISKNNKNIEVHIATKPERDIHTYNYIPNSKWKLTQVIDCKTLRIYRF